MSLIATRTLKVGYDVKYNACLHRCGFEFGHQVIKHPAFVTVLLATDHYGNMIKHDHATAAANSKVPYAADDVVDVGGTKVVVEEHTTSTES